MEYLTNYKNYKACQASMHIKVVTITELWLPVMGFCDPHHIQTMAERPGKN